MDEIDQMLKQTARSMLSTNNVGWGHDPQSLPGGRRSRLRGPQSVDALLTGGDNLVDAPFQSGNGELAVLVGLNPSDFLAMVKD